MNDLLDITHCTLCPRACGADRRIAAGACGAGEKIMVAKAALHYFEEPPVSGTRGSGAVFFRGCNLRCGYCQNAAISHGKQTGGETSPEELAQILLRLQDEGAHNINLVTAGHFLPQILPVLGAVKPKLHIPVVYNCSGYEKKEAIALLDGLIDVYLPDCKYASAAAAAKYSGAADYPEVARAAIAEMVRQTGAWQEREGIVQKGTLIRHLVLPSLSHDGVEVMRTIAALFPAARVSVMRQYTPSFNKTGDPAFSRKVTALEYNRVLSAARSLGLMGYCQEKGSESAAFTPDFSYSP